jgi:predicted DNA-binding transcriptional regulator AlpA
VKAKEVLELLRISRPTLARLVKREEILRKMLKDAIGQ